MAKLFINGVVGSVKTGTTQKGLKYTQISIGERVDKENVNWFNCTAFDSSEMGGNATFIEKYAPKGTIISVECRFTEKQTDINGKKYNLPNTVIDEVKILHFAKKEDEENVEDTPVAETENLPFY